MLKEYPAATRALGDNELRAYEALWGSLPDGRFPFASLLEELPHLEDAAGATATLWPVPKLHGAWKRQTPHETSTHRHSDTFHARPTVVQLCQARPVQYGSPVHEPSLCEHVFTQHIGWCNGGLLSFPTAVFEAVLDADEQQAGVLTAVRADSEAAHVGGLQVPLSVPTSVGTAVPSIRS